MSGASRRDKGLVRLRWVRRTMQRAMAPRLDRRGRVFPASCADAGCGKRGCLHALAGKRGRACHARDGAGRGERHRKRGLKPGCRQASDNNPQACRYSGRFELCPIRGECNRRWIGGRPPRGAKIETWPRLAGHGKLEGLTDAAEDVAFGDAARVACINSRA
jgi:hypothetical protein